MRSAVRQLVLFGLFSMAVLPALWQAAATLEVFSSSNGSTDNRFAVLLWWLGLAGIVALPVKPHALSAGTLNAILAASTALLGSAGAAWMEYQAFTDPKQLLPPGFYAAPYLALFGFTQLLHRKA